MSHQAKQDLIWVTRVDLEEGLIADTPNPAAILRKGTLFIAKKGFPITAFNNDFKPGAFLISPCPARRDGTLNWRNGRQIIGVGMDFSSKFWGPYSRQTADQGLFFPEGTIGPQGSELQFVEAGCFWKSGHKPRLFDSKVAEILPAILGHECLTLVDSHLVLAPVLSFDEAVTPW